MLFCPPLDDWTLYAMHGKARNVVSRTWFDKCSIHYAYSVWTLWCSQVWLYCSYQCSYQYIVTAVKQPFFTFRVIVHKYATTPKAELFCSCKRRKFVGQNKVKICKLQSQSFKLLGQKIGCPSDHLNGNVSSYLNCLLLCLLVSIFVWSHKEKLLKLLFLFRAKFFLKYFPNSTWFLYREKISNRNNPEV